MIRAVLFDLDNTLVDFMGMKRVCCEAAVDSMIRCGLQMEKRKALDLLFALYKKHGLEYNHIFEDFVKSLKGKTDYRLVADGIIAYRKQQNAYMRPYPEVIPTLIKLKEMGLKLGIVSDAPAIKGWMRLTETGIVDFFDAVVTFDDTGERKPSKKPFLLALGKLGAKPQETLFVGDWPERDMGGAHAVGMKTAFAVYGSEHKGKGAKADFYPKRFSDIIKFVR